MKTTKIINIALLAAVLFASCDKDDVDGNRLRLFVDPMSYGDAKVLFDPANIDDGSWIVGEQINLNGTPYPVALDNEDHPCLNMGNDELPSTLYAIYPATIKDNLGNDIEVVNGCAGACGIGIRSLAINFHTTDHSHNGTLNGKHDVIFPMAATAASNKNQLFFNHLTGGIKLTVANNRAQSITVTRFVVRATQEFGGPAIYRDLAPEWATSTLPVLPHLPARHNESNDQNMGGGFMSDMTLMMNTESAAGVTIPGKVDDTPGSITFCIPMLAKDLKYIQIIGYNGSSPVFQTPKKNIGTAKNIVRNKMYGMPVINID